MVYLSRSYPFKFFKDRLPQIFLGPFLNTLSHISLWISLQISVLLPHIQNKLFSCLGLYVTSCLTSLVPNVLSCSTHFMPYLLWCHKCLVLHVYQVPRALHILVYIMSCIMSYVYKVSYV